MDTIKVRAKDIDNYPKRKHRYSARTTGLLHIPGKEMLARVEVIPLLEIHWDTVQALLTFQSPLPRVIQYTHNPSIHIMDRAKDHLKEGPLLHLILIQFLPTSSMMNLKVIETN